MGLDLERLEHLKPKGRGHVAACPACREAGMDKSGNHLFVAEDGRFGCLLNEGPGGHEHRKRVFELVGKRETAPRPLAYRMNRTATRPAPSPRYIPNDKLPALCSPSDEDLKQIARVRGWDATLALPALREIASRGLLSVSELWGVPCWVVSDSTRFAWKARRLDGAKWKTQDGEAKSIALGKQLSAWPVGTDTIGRHRFPFVVLCEGEPDMLAAAVIAHAEGCDLSRIGFAVMLGAAPAIDSKALPTFAGRSILILRQNDATHGKSAQVVREWCQQLHGAGAKLKVSDFSRLAVPGGCKDAGDYAKLLGSPSLPRLFDTLKVAAPVAPHPQSEGPRKPRDGERCRLDKAASVLGEWVFDRNGDTVFREGIGYVALRPLCGVDE